MKPGPSWPLINILFLFFKCSNSESEGDEQESGFPTVAERLRLDVEDLRNKVIYIHVTYIHYFNLWQSRPPFMVCNRYNVVLFCRTKRKQAAQMNREVARYKTIIY